jgi:hypothetical protein
MERSGGLRGVHAAFGEGGNKAEMGDELMLRRVEMDMEWLQLGGWR